MKKALVKNGVVENVVLVADDVAESLFGADYDQIVALEEKTSVAPGWAYDGAEFTNPATGLEDNAVILQRRRDALLAKVRELRSRKLTEVDHMVDDLTLGIRSDAEAIKVYKQALLDITEPYKDSVDPMKGTTALDAFDRISLSFTWPTKP